MATCKMSIHFAGNIYTQNVNRTHTRTNNLQDTEIVNACFRVSVVAARATSGVGAQVLVRNYWINTHCVSVARTTLIVVAKPTLRRVIMLEFLWTGYVYLFRIPLSGKFDRLK